VWIEDSPRNLPRWIIESVSSGYASGAVITPWATPFRHRAGAGQKASAAACISELQAGGVEVMFDPMTHVLQMSGVGDLRYYQEYDLWTGPQEDLSDQGLIEGHVGYVTVGNGSDAFALEREVQRGALTVGKPFLNPL
jgi:hypothetical protein